MFINFYSILNLSTNYNKPIGNGIITALNLNKLNKEAININEKNQIKDQKLQMQYIYLKNGPKKI